MDKIKNLTDEKQIAYLSMEFRLDSNTPTYSGGLLKGLKIKSEEEFRVERRF